LDPSTPEQEPQDGRSRRIRARGDRAQKVSTTPPEEVLAAARSITDAAMAQYVDEHEEEWGIRLNSVERKLLEPLLMGLGVEAAADRTGIARALARKAFRPDGPLRTALSRARSERFHRAREAMELASQAAIDTHVEIMVNPAIPAEIRQRSADSILDRAGLTKGAGAGSGDGNVILNLILSASTARALPERTVVDVEPAPAGEAVVREERRRR
jgi:hypothetical protein